MVALFHEVCGRFPLGEPGGQVPASGEVPSGPGTRPFGLRYLVPPHVVECAKHKKPATRNTKTKPTQYTEDGRLVRDTESYVEYD